MGGTSKLVVVGVVALLWVSGCLENDASMFVRHEAGADRFGVLTVYEHFRSGGMNRISQGVAVDAETLEELWAARERVIPVEPSIFGTPVYMELSADRRSVVDAADDVKGAGIAWETIEIRPGKMFRDADGALGYYHEVWIPGDVVDRWLRLAALRLAKNEEFAKAIATERARREGRGARRSWADVTARVRERWEAGLARLDLRDAERGREEAMWGELWGCLEDRSLEALRAWAAEGKVAFVRRGRIVTLGVPLADSDARGVATLLAELGKVWGAFAGREGDAGPEARVARRLWERVARAVECKVVEGGLDLSVDVVAAQGGVVSSLGETRAEVYRADPGKVAAARAMADAVGAKVTVSEGVKVGEVVEEFMGRGR
jgi:hypothetical protein